MNVDDATCEVIDTSDREERELLKAQISGYHERVWGESSAETGIYREKSSTNASLPPQLQPRTPQHQRLTSMSDLDPSPDFSHLRISPKNSNMSSHVPVTPFTTLIDALATSEPHANALDSTMQLSSPLISSNNYFPIKNDAPFKGSLAQELILDDSPQGYSLAFVREPNCVSPRKSYPNDVRDITYPSASACHPSIANPNYNAIVVPDCGAICSPSRSSSPPLEFPLSPSPDPLALLQKSSRHGSRSFGLDPEYSHSNYPQDPDGVGECGSEPIPMDDNDHIWDIFVDSPVNNSNMTQHGLNKFEHPNSGTSLDRFSFPSFTLNDRSLPREAPKHTEPDHEGSSNLFRANAPSFTPLPLIQPLSRLVTPTPSSPLSPAPISPVANAIPAPAPFFSPITIPPDLNPPARTYSLRNRSAMQLKPFQYEDKLYKKQMRGIPEAIVKHTAAVVGRRARERYEQEEEWGDQGEHFEDDGDAQKMSRARRGGKQRTEAMNKPISGLEIPFPSDEDEGELRQSIAKPNATDGCFEKRGKKRKRDVITREFPPVVEEKSSYSHAPSNDGTGNLPSRTRPRPRPASRQRLATPDPPMSTQKPSSHSSLTLMDPDAQNGELDEFNLPARVMGADRTSSPTRIDHIEWVEHLRGSTHHNGQDSDFQMNEASDTPDNSGDGRSNSGEQPSEVEFTEKDWKKLRAMQRMMPAALVNKLLKAGEEQKPKKKKSRVHQSDSGDDGQAPLRPGQGRKRIVSPGSKEPTRYEIRGDPESESEIERQIDPLVNQEIIEIQDSDDGSGGNPERSLEESEGDVDEGEIETWFASDLERMPKNGAFAGSSTSRMRRPDYERDRPRGGSLIDRMLQRTNRVRPRDPRSAKRSGDRVNVKGPRDSSSRPALDIITRDARKYGAGGGRQTKLSFSKTNLPGASSFVGPDCSSKDVDQKHHVESFSGRKEKTMKTKRKEARRGVQAQLLVVPGGENKITSGRRREVIYIDDEDDALYEALVPEGRIEPSRPRRHKNSLTKKQKRMQDIVEKFRVANVGEEPDVFDPHPHGGQNSHVTLDLDIPHLPVGMTFGPESYIGKGRLAQLVSILKDEIEAPRPLASTTFEPKVDPAIPISQFSTLLATICDHLYDMSIAAVDDPEFSLKIKTSELTMYTLCQLVSFRAWGADDENGQIAGAVSEQVAHLIGRVNNRLEVVSADGYILDPRSFDLYWFAVELELRAAFARRTRRGMKVDQFMVSKVSAEHYATLLLRRLLEYGLDRTLQPLEQGEPMDITSPNFRTMELWARFAHIAPFFDESENDASAPSSFWRIVEASLEQQSNKPDSGLDASEHLWRTLFSLCTITQFSVHGLAMSTFRLAQHWPMVLKGLESIRLSANERLDHSKPASTLKKRDKYLRLVTARCLLLDVRYHWSLSDADSVLRELCSIFRSRGFSNLMGETSDFPMFIRDRDEPHFHADTKTDTAFGVFLKMIIRALKGFKDVDGLTRGRKISKLLGLAVPVGSISFTKASPPLGQELSMLYNRYSAIFVAVYVEPTPSHIRNRLQHVRRYIVFKEADCDSQRASIRAMMNLAILLRHLEQPLDDILAWASEMLEDLLDNYNAAERDNESSQNEKNEIVLSILLLLGSVRMIIEHPILNRSEPRPAKYPDLALLREDWITRILSSSSLNDNKRTAIEIRKYIQSFLTARRNVIPPPPIPKHFVDQVESQDEYGDAGLDMDDPAVLELLDTFEASPDAKFVIDKEASEIMSTIATKRLYSPVCRHLAQNVDVHSLGDYFLEGDEWIECWVGCASVAVRNKARDWKFFIKMARAACDGVKINAFCRRRIYMRFLLTILQLDPTSYASNEDQFVQVWFETIVSSELTIEHEFNGQLFSVGALNHALFHGLPCAADLSTGMVSFEKLELEVLRQELIDVAIGNVAENLKIAAPSQAELYISFVEKALRTLREGFESPWRDDLKRAKYANLCAFVHAAIKKHAALGGAQTLQSALYQGNV